MSGISSKTCCLKAVIRFKTIIIGYILMFELINRKTVFFRGRRFLRLFLSFLLIFLQLRNLFIIGIDDFRGSRAYGFKRALGGFVSCSVTLTGGA